MAEQAIPVAVASSRRHPKRSANGIHRDNGYTLIEMLIVCAVLTALATMSWPAMRGMLSKGRLKQAADDLEATLHKTRTRAIQSGALLTLRYVPGGRTYRIEHWNAMHRDPTPELLGDEPAGAAPLLEESAHGMPPIVTELPQGVRFARSGPQAADGLQAFPSPSTHVDATIDAEPIAAESRLSDAAAVEWSEPIGFHANGRSENASIRLVDERRFFIDVTLRGMTGRVKTTAPARLPLDPMLTAADDRRTETFEGEEEPR